jgi:hypothetical protein
VSATILGSALLGSTLLGTNPQGHPSSSSPLHGSGGPTSSQGGSTNPPSPHQGSGSQHTMAGANPPPPLQMAYLASLNIPDLTKLTNDPILHDATWPAMPTKLPSDIPKFEGKAGDDPANHVMTFHLWCSSNSIMEDSVRLRLFQRTLTGPSAKWYVEEKSGSHSTFESLAKAFLTFFQLPIRHDNGLELPSNFKQSSATHIADHIHEWRRRRSLCKAETTKQQCLDWFLRSLVALLEKDVASTFPQSMKRKPSVKPSNMTSSMHNQDTCTQYSLISQNLCHLARTNLGCLIQQTDSLVLPCIIVHNPSHHQCMGPLNTHQHMGALLITPHPLTNNHTPWLHPHPLVDRHQHLPYICLFQTQVVPPPHHLIVQAKA